MAKFVLQSVRKNSVYVVVTLDNGDSFGQTLHDLTETKDTQTALDEIQQRLRGLVGTVKVRPVNTDLKTILDAATGREIQITNIQT